METEADRLESLRALGGQLLSCDSGSFMAIFDNVYLDSGGIDEMASYLTCRTSDVVALKLVKGSVIPIASVPYKVRRNESDGTGMTRLVLEK